MYECHVGTKPAMAANKTKGALSIGEHIMPLNLFKYKRYVDVIKENEALSIEEFKKSDWAKYFTIDITYTFRNGKANPNHMFEIFANLSNNRATDVRVALLQNVADDVDFYMARNTVCLPQRSTSFETWVERMGDERVFCDELGLMGLCNLYKKHCFVLKKDKLWSSIESDRPLKLMDLLKSCPVRLVYLGKLRFASLKWHPKLTPKKSTGKGQFEIVEEYTLDDSPTINESTSLNIVPEHVETAVTTPPSVPVTGTQTEPSTSKEQNFCSVVPETTTTDNNLALPVETAPPATKDVTDASSACIRNDAEHVGTADITHYPWKKKLCINVSRLDDLEVDLWCNNIRNYYVFKPRQAKPVKRSASGKVKTTKEDATPTPNQLIARAKSLINQSKEWIDSAVTVKPEPVGKGVAMVEATGSKLHVETHNKKKALSSLHAVTIAKLSPPSSEIQPVGDTSTPPQPLPRSTPKVNRTVGCKMCEKSFPSVRDLNTHHRAEHGIVKCHHCNRAFGTRTALDKHMYLHRDLDFLCTTCGKTFPFQSGLDQHKLVHQADSTLECTEPGCDKKFKGVGDYNRHLKTHQDGGWYPCDHCDYKNKGPTKHHVTYAYSF